MIMKSLAAIVGIVALGLVGTGVMQAAGADEDVIRGQYIIVLNEGADAGSVARAHGLVPDHLYSRALNGFAGAVPAGRLDALRADPRVNNVVPDRRVSIPPEPDKDTPVDQTPGNGNGRPGGGGATNGQVVPAGVQRIGANTVSYTGSGIGVAIIDTGLDFSHSDLTVATVCFTAFTSCQDDNGHGTHVGGIVAAKNNSQDVVGVAPDATLYAVKVLSSSGSGSWSGVTAGIDWITANADSVSPKIRVANMSLGGSGSDSANCGVTGGVTVDPLHKAICSSVAAGITYVVAAGNSPTVEVSQQVPAAYPEVMAIASTTAETGTEQCNFLSSPIQADTASYFTTDGTAVSVSAPGEEQEDVNKGCLIKSVGILSTRLGGGTTRMSGTSMASPHVAGVAALVLQKSPSLAPADVRTKIEGSADRPGQAPLDSPTSSYTFDGEREGVVSAQGG